ncbi:MAG: CDP-glucose 4,6-dehydratase [Syntrophaceae bacterium]|nr:CDP-glucose 4,6-dehydratase [Syntrophaceae bacterium]
MNPLEDFYRGRRVMVTGHTGFKGSWLALWLRKLGAEVTGFALPPATDPSHFSILGLETRIRHREGDVRDPSALHNVFAEAKPEVVFHLAAQAIVRSSYEDPKETFDVNIGGTVNVLEAIRQTKSIRSVVIVTSDKCYENREWVWGYREEDPLGGHDPYSASKGAVEIVCGAYARSYFGTGGRGPRFGFATARAGNVIGGGDWAADRLIPDCVRALAAGKAVVIRNPGATRPWQHVLDPLSAYLFLARRLAEEPDRFSGPWNFGPADGSSMPVRELAARFVTCWPDGRLRLGGGRKNAPHEAHALALCVDKARKILGWQPVLSTGEAVDWTAAWYRAWQEGRGNHRALSLRQIGQYEKKRRT